MLRELLSRFSHRGIQRLSWSKGPGYFPNWRQNIMPSMWCWFFKHAVMEVTIKSLKKKKVCEVRPCVAGLDCWERVPE